MEALSVSVVDGPAIIIGYEYRLQIEAESPVFLASATFAGHLRAKVSALAVLATLTTGSGGLLRRSDTVLELIVPPDATERLAPGSAVVDLVRTDLQAAYEGIPVPPERIAFRIKQDRDLVDAALTYLVSRREARVSRMRGKAGYVPVRKQPV